VENNPTNVETCTSLLSVKGGKQPIAGIVSGTRLGAFIKKFDVLVTNPTKFCLSGRYSGVSLRVAYLWPADYRKTPGLSLIILHHFISVHCTLS